MQLKYANAIVIFMWLGCSLSESLVCYEWKDKFFGRMQELDPVTCDGYNHDGKYCYTAKTKCKIVCVVR